MGVLGCYAIVTYSSYSFESDFVELSFLPEGFLIVFLVYLFGLFPLPPPKFCTTLDLNNSDRNVKFTIGIGGRICHGVHCDSVSWESITTIV
jgi:hypothetical protein